MSASPPPPRERRTHVRRGWLEPFLDWFYGLVRWIVGHVRGFYAAVGLFLAFGLGLSVGALALFALLAELVGAGVTQRIDQAVLVWVDRYTNAVFDGLALLGAALGSSGAVWLALIIGTVYFWRSGHHYSAALLWVALIGGRILNRLLKAFYDRPRPEFWAGDIELLGYQFSFPGSASFPSGHAITSVIVFGTLAYLIIRLEPTIRMRRWTIAGAAALILLIGLSRIYLRVHYPSDVVAGYLAGFIWATACALTIEVIRYAAARRPELAREEADLEKGIEPLREAVEEN